MTIVLRSVGVLILCLAGILARMQLDQTFDPPPRLPRSFHSPIVALELVRTADDVRAVLGDPSGQHNREVMKRQITLDWAFIPIYWICFTGLGLVLLACHWPGGRILGVIVVLAALAAALCDVLENLRILLVLNAPPHGLSDAMAESIRHASLAKWGLLAIVEAGLAILFLAFGRREFILKTLTSIAGWAFGIAATLGVLGVANPRVLKDFVLDGEPPMIEWSSAGLAIGLLAALPILLFLPGRFLSGLGIDGPWERAGRHSYWVALFILILAIALFALVLVIRTRILRGAILEQPTSAIVRPV